MSTYGTLLKVTTFGESHGKGIGCVIDGFLPNITINFEEIQKQLNRRKPNQSKLTSNRNEPDKLIVLSGFDDNKTLGTPITFLIENEDVKKDLYSNFINIPRPGHGDYTYFMKYNVKNKSGSSRFSGRETATRVAAGSCIEQWLKNYYNIHIISYVYSVGNIKIPKLVNEMFENNPPSREIIDKYGCVKYNKDKKIFMDYFNNIYDLDGILTSSEKEENNIQCNNKTIIIHNNEWISLQTRCPHPYTAVQICSCILKIKNKGDSIGGIATCVIQNIPIGIGEPIFDKLESELGKVILSIPAIKGIEFGSGFNGSYMLGSEHNDLFAPLEKNKTKNSYLNEENKCVNSNINEIKEEHQYEQVKKELEINNTNDDKKKKKFCENEYEGKNISNKYCTMSNKHKLLITKSNNCGGILAGISTGNNVIFRSAIKPVSSIQIEKETSDFEGELCTLRVKGMHDCCILPRIPPVIEASSYIVVGDMILRQVSKYGDKNLPSISSYIKYNNDEN
ncbi:chorismate synthase, putative [Plasmodium berghei]|uniref:chorismate synthase n=2 Tax=Plasmodium berghei TaxID=5821 RepID=A0A509AM77_PLABA|nr:chorismate synthase [Plasmodium berghei ANKA]CXI64155.1 chorismate synthase, putative [Plasmodium berghei]SCM23860.1 chorismate synthase, putative [Plasmodium berghei]SCN26809.1 chorismate synthase, putative [Plasmodium berghei]SCO61166.1 chorismate synthase, putative [Plasmodium berghei]SCO63229.1 chorismate synthase, putative [Plasmodium berghei]|eukprot:XP_034422426.1 chorismate synthase [Plasmodium berghei ANKA]